MTSETPETADSTPQTIADSTTPTIKDALDEYIRSLKPNGKSKAKSRGADKPVDPNVLMLQDFARYFDPENNLRDLTQNEVSEYSDKVNDDPDKGDDPETSAADHLQAVKGFLTYANRRGWTDENLARHIRITIKNALDLYSKNLKPKTKNDKPVNQNTFQDFLRHFDSQDIYILRDLTRKDVRDYCDEVNDSRATIGAADHIQAVKGFLAYASEQDFTDENLARHIRITIKDALDLYTRSLNANAKPKAKSRNADKPVDPRMLQGFLRYFNSKNSLRDLNQNEITAYSADVNNDRDKNNNSKNRSSGGFNTNAGERLQAVKGFLAYANKQDYTDENLARHIRIRKHPGRAGKPIPRGAESIDLTSQGHRALEDERERLLAETQTLLDDIHRARADGDVTENSPLDAAREEHARKEARIKEINATLERAVVLDAAAAADAQVVRIGAQVEVKDSENKPATYTLVNSNEARPLDRRISDDSPMGEALLGKQVGDEVEVGTPRGARRYTIISIS